MDNQSANSILSQIRPIDIRAELFKKGDYDFIVKRKVNGVERENKKQRKALEILRCGLYDEFMFGGAAGPGKSWVGCAWLLFMGILYPGTRWFIARNQLKDLEDSVMVTWRKVCREYGFEEGKDWKYNGQKYFIEFFNGDSKTPPTHINLIEIKYQPSDPEFEDLGSTEYTGGWIEEVGEVHPDGATALFTRTGRHMNDEYNIKKIVFYTCNPKKNWAKRLFYDPWTKGELKERKMFLPALITDNPFMPDLDGYIRTLDDLRDKNKSMYKRLRHGDWNYEDNPNQLAHDEMIEAIFDDNDHIKHGTTYITADVARFGSDKAVIIVWSGWRIIRIVTFDFSKTTDIEIAIMTMRVKYRVPKKRCIADADGVGGGVVDGAGVKGFNNNARPIKRAGDDQNYRNLQVQCLYLLADKINEGEIYVDTDVQDEQKEHIIEELAQIQAKNSDYRKLDCKSKSEIKDSIGRSPDYRDAMLMRVYFDLRPTSTTRASSVSRRAV